MIANESMKAAVLEGLDKLNICHIKKPEIKSGTVLVKVHTCAICGSDIRIIKKGNNRVEYPKTIGHEIAGEVVEIGEGVTKFTAGDRITMLADIPCGECSSCKKSLFDECETDFAIGYEMNGGMAEYILLEAAVVKHGSVLKIPEYISYDEAALSEPLSCCVKGMKISQMENGKSVLVMGAGPIGCMHIMIAKYMGAELTILTDIDKNRLEMSKISNADYYIDSMEEDVLERVKEITKGRGVDIVMVACPSSKAQEQSIYLAKRRGIVTFFGGLPPNERTIKMNSNLIHYNELQVVGSHGSSNKYHKIAIDILKSKNRDIKKLITRRCRLEEVNYAIERLINKEELKIVVNPWR